MSESISFGSRPNDDKTAQRHEREVNSEQHRTGFPFRSKATRMHVTNHRAHNAIDQQAAMVPAGAKAQALLQLTA